MYVALENFDAGGELQFKKGDFVSCDEATAAELLKKGFIKVAPESEVKPQEDTIETPVPTKEDEKAKSPKGKRKGE